MEMQCTGSKSPRRKLGGAPIKLWGVMHDQSTGCALQPGNPELQRELKKFARRAAALAAEDSARKELEEMKGEGK